MYAVHQFLKYNSDCADSACLKSKGIEASHHFFPIPNISPDLNSTRSKEISISQWEQRATRVQRTCLEDYGRYSGLDEEEWSSLVFDLRLETLSHCSTRSNTMSTSVVTVLLSFFHAARTISSIKSDGSLI